MQSEAAAAATGCPESHVVTPPTDAQALLSFTLLSFTISSISSTSSDWWGFFFFFFFVANNMRSRSELHAVARIVCVCVPSIHVTRNTQSMTLHWFPASYHRLRKLREWIGEKGVVWWCMGSCVCAWRDWGNRYPQMWFFILFYVLNRRWACTRYVCMICNKTLTLFWMGGVAEDLEVVWAWKWFFFWYFLLFYGGEKVGRHFWLGWMQLVGCLYVAS